MLLSLIPIPALAGTVTCAGKAYHDIVFATLTDFSGVQLVRMWTVEGKTTFMTMHITPKYAVTLNNEMMCEFEDVRLRIVDAANPANNTDLSEEK
jgi:hypothetical protein